MDGTMHAGPSGTNHPTRLTLLYRVCVEIQHSAAIGSRFKMRKDLGIIIVAEIQLRSRKACLNPWGKHRGVGTAAIFHCHGIACSRRTSLFVRRWESLDVLFLEED
jgi:hypothetical protein